MLTIFDFKGLYIVSFFLFRNQYKNDEWILTSIDLFRACYRHVPIILDVSIEVSQFKEYRIVIVSRCLVPEDGNVLIV